MDPLPIATNRLTLRRFLEEDLPEFHNYRADPEVARYQDWTNQEQDAAAFFLKQQRAQFATPGEWFQIALALKDSNLLVGDIGVCLEGADSRWAEIGFSLARRHQGRGLATEAVERVMKLIFEATAVEKVSAVTDTRNGPSTRLLGRLGMHVEKTERVLFKGETCEEWTFVMFRTEWLDRENSD